MTTQNQNPSKKNNEGTLSFIDMKSGITLNQVINKLDKDARVALISREIIEDIDTECYFTQIILTDGLFGNDKSSEIDSALKMVTQIRPDIIVFNEPLLEDGTCSRSVLEALWSGVNLVTTDNPADISKLTTHLGSGDDLLDLNAYMGEIYTA